MNRPVNRRKEVLSIDHKHLLVRPRCEDADPVFVRASYYTLVGPVRCECF